MTKKILICTTQRSGSTMICDDMQRVGLARPDEHPDREAAESELRYFEAKHSPVPQHVRDMLAVIAPDVDPDLPDEDD